MCGHLPDWAKTPPRAITGPNTRQLLHWAASERGSESTPPVVPDGNGGGRPQLDLSLFLSLHLHRCDCDATLTTSMATTIASGLRSPPTPRSSAPSPRPSTAPSPRPTFDAELLKAYMKELLQSTLKNATWPEPRERDKVKAWIKEIGERVKKRMLGTSPAARYGIRPDLSGSSPPSPLSWCPVLLRTCVHVSLAAPRPAS